MVSLLILLDRFINPGRRLCHADEGDMAVRMRKKLARPWVGVRVCHLLLYTTY